MQEGFMQAALTSVLFMALFQTGNPESPSATSAASTVSSVSSAGAMSWRLVAKLASLCRFPLCPGRQFVETRLPRHWNNAHHGHKMASVASRLGS